MVNLSLVFTENQHIGEFSPIMKVSFQRTKREDFFTRYFVGVLAYVVISRHFILKSIIWRLSSWKADFIESPEFHWFACIKLFLNKLYNKLCVYNCRLFSFQYYVTIFLFYQKQNIWAFNIILGVTKKAVAFKRYP